MKVKTSYSLSFRPLPVFGHRIRSSWRACFRGSIDFCHPAGGDFLHMAHRNLVSIDRSIVNDFVRVYVDCRIDFIV